MLKVNETYPVGKILYTDRMEAWSLVSAYFSDDTENNIWVNDLKQLKLPLRFYNEID